MEKTAHPGIAMAAWVRPRTKTMSNVICRSSAPARHGAGRVEARMPRSRAGSARPRIPGQVFGEMRMDTLSPGNRSPGRRPYRSNGGGARIQRDRVYCILVHKCI